MSFPIPVVPAAPAPAPKPPKVVVKPIDAIGQDITLDAVVVVPTGVSSLVVGRVTKISPKTIKVRRIGDSDHSWLLQKPFAECVVLGELSAATMYVLTNGKVMR